MFDGVVRVARLRSPRDVPILNLGSPLATRRSSPPSLKTAGPANVTGKPARKSPPAKAAARASGGNKPGGANSLGKQLAKLGLGSDFSLVLHLPLRYEDETRVTPIAEARDGMPVQVEVDVASCEVAFRPRRQLVVRVHDESGDAILRFYNFYPSQQKALAAGTRIRAFGELRRGFFGSEMVHPRFHALRGAEPLPGALTPIYPTTAGLAQTVLKRLIERALGRARLDDTLPAAMLKRHELLDFSAAVILLHRPPPGASMEALAERRDPAWRRMKFDELLAQQLSMRKHYRERRARAARPLAGGGELVPRMLRGVGFALTGAQQRAWAQIEADLEQTHPMHRLLQGDVGSGKTVVAALAALRAAECGLQTAVMAPTEILAEQHFRKFNEWLAPLGLRVAWLTGSQSRAEREAALALVASGEAPVVVGTHALFQDAVVFRGLGLAIVDEQHRFGVAQRVALRSKGESDSSKGESDSKGDDGKAPEGVIREPHLLMMSATPIPRTLSMSYLADLDVSVIDELPPGRTPVTTKLVASGRRDEVVHRVRDACATGVQAYWVCPLIEESEALDLQTAIDTHAALTAELPGLVVGLVHGRMPPAEKAAVMAEFSAGRVQVLVATTVIEVGVDVPNAALMVIEHAERFGLSQLHQLRGRVGRGVAKSVCILLYQGPLGDTARRRLRVIYENTDGFVIAREDLLIRGPGEFLGARQSGAPLLRFADLVADEDLVVQAREAADELLENDEASANRHLERWMGGKSDFLRA